MRSQGTIIFLACHTPLQAQKSTGGMFQQAGFPSVDGPMQVSQLFVLVQGGLVPSGD